MNIFMINLLSFIVSDCVRSTEQNVKIFHRNVDPDLHNGHAKPSQAERQITSWHIINKKPAARTNKYFVTWRPDLGEEREEEEHRDILSTILAKHEGDQVNFKPQFYFSHDKAPTSKPLVNSVSPPSSPSPPTTPTWSYKPVFNKIFSSKYRPTFQPSTTTPALSSTTITTTTTTTTTISTTTVLTTRRSVVTTSSVLSVDQTLDDGILKPFQSNLPFQEEETAPQSPSSFISYIRDLLVTFLRSDLISLNNICTFIIPLL